MKVRHILPINPRSLLCQVVTHRYGDQYVSGRSAPEPCASDPLSIVGNKSLSLGALAVISDGTHFEAVEARELSQDESVRDVVQEPRGTHVTLELTIQR